MIPAYSHLHLMPIYSKIMIGYTGTSLDTVNFDELLQVGEVKFQVSSVISTLSVSNSKLTSFSQAQVEDSVCSTLISYCRNGWPNKSSLPSCMKPYWKLQGEYSLHDNLCCIKTELLFRKSYKKTSCKSFIKATRAYNIAAFVPNPQCGGYTFPKISTFTYSNAQSA